MITNRPILWLRMKDLELLNSRQSLAGLADVFKERLLKESVSRHKGLKGDSLQIRLA